MFSCTMYTKDVSVQAFLPRKAFVTFITIVDDYFVMCILDMLVQVISPREAFFTIMTTVSDFLMNTLDM